MFKHIKFIDNPPIKPWVIVLFALMGNFFQPINSSAQNPSLLSFVVDTTYGNYVHALAEENGYIWVGTYASGLIRFDPSTNEIIKYGYIGPDSGHYAIYSMTIDSAGNKWIITTNIEFEVQEPDVLSKFDGMQWTNYRPTDFFPNIRTRSDVFFRSIAFDKDGTMWIGTAISGLIKFKDKNNWEVYDTTNSKLPSNLINSIIFDSVGNIIIGAYKGLVKFDGDSTWVVWDSLDTGPFSNNSYAIPVVDLNGNIWVGCYDRFSGYGVVCKVTDFTTYEEFETPVLPGNYVYSIALDADNSIWVGTNKGWVRYDGTDWIYYPPIGDNMITDIIIDKYGNKWINANYLFTNRGIIYAFREDGVILDVKSEPASSNSIYPNPARDFINTADYLGWEYQMYDLLGNNVQMGLVNSENINISKLSAGFYTIRFFKEGKQEVKKFIKV
ncbi:MAG: two-component regulator propeller domain-containing protein [Chloroherpetonaceae bacterium]